ncbi:hypothetical protein HK101_007130, partial [Irineochytrium annulatum]
MVMDNFPTMVINWNNITDDFTVASEYQINLSLKIYGTILATWTLILLIIGLVVFMPSNRWIAYQRQLSLKAFLEIPQDVCIELYGQYRFETNHAGDDNEEAVSDAGDDDDEDDEINPETGKTVFYEKRGSRFKRITSLYLGVLTQLLVLFAADVAVAMILVSVQLSHAGRRVERSAQILFIAQGFAGIATEKAVSDPFNMVGVNMINKIFEEELGLLRSYKDALQYGNASLFLPAYSLTAQERAAFFDQTYVGNTLSLDQLCDQVLDDARILWKADTVSMSDPTYLRLMQNTPEVVRGFINLSAIINENFDSYEYMLIMIEAYI